MIENSRPLVDALARNLDKIVDRLTGRSTSAGERMIEMGMHLLPFIQQIAQRPRPIGADDGVRERQVRAEFEAEHATLQREFSEKHARLVAAFGPRFVEARKADRADDAARDDAERAVEFAAAAAARPEVNEAARPSA